LTILLILVKLVLLLTFCTSPGDSSFACALIFRLLNARLNSPPVNEGAGETGLEGGAVAVTVSEYPVELDPALAVPASTLEVEIGVRLVGIGIGAELVGGGSHKGGGGMANVGSTIEDDFKLIGANNFGSALLKFKFEDDPELLIPTPNPWPGVRPGPMKLSNTFSLIIPQCLNNHPNTL
jgi:hypothetical protein